MRLFVAVKIPEEIREKAAAVAGELLQEQPEAAGGMQNILNTSVYKIA